MQPAISEYSYKGQLAKQRKASGSRGMSHTYGLGLGKNSKIRPKIDFSSQLAGLHVPK